MPANLSPNAKRNVAAVAAVVMAGVTAYQATVRGGHFTWWDLIPILAAVFGVATTARVDNTISSPAAKAVVHGALSALAAVTAALAAVVGSEPSGVSLAKLAVAGLGTLAVWAYPELQTGPGAPLAADVATGHLSERDILAALAELDQPTPTPMPAAVPAPAPVRPVPVPGPVTQPMPAVAATPAPTPAVVEPTPIADAAQAAAAATTPPAAVPAPAAVPTVPAA